MKPTYRLRSALRVLGLDDWPITPAALAAAWRERVRATHPDRGGSPSAFVAVQAARDVVEEFLAGQSNPEGRGWSPGPLWRAMHVGRTSRINAREFFDLFGWRRVRGRPGVITRVFGEVRVTIYPRRGAFYFSITHRGCTRIWPSCGFPDRREASVAAWIQVRVD